MSFEESVAFIRQELYQEDGIYAFSRFGELRCILLEFTKEMFLLQILFVVYWGTSRIFIYDKKVKDYYSNIEGKTLSSIRIILLVFVVTSLC